MCKVFKVLCSITQSALSCMRTAGDMGEDLNSRDGHSVFSGDFESQLSDGNISLDPDLLPFPRGRFSFGVGVNLKMAVSRWTNWAADVGLREENMGAEEG